MRQALPKNLLHNPFQNRFKDPVTQRQDDMQSRAYTVWLRERNLEQSGFKIPESVRMTSISSASSHAGRIFAGAFALVLVVLVSVAVLLKAF
jgi:hypothetical protein